MWLLKNVKTGQYFFLVQDKAKYTIGKIRTDLVIKDDDSISRTHASLHLKLGADGKMQIELEDGTSKYGTFLNEGIVKNTRISKQERIVLKDNDRIRFGAMGNIWNVNEMILRTVTSALPEPEVKKLECIMRQLGGVILEKYESNCTHLTMSHISVTLKLLHALVDQIPVVTFKYWTDLMSEARCNEYTLANPRDYIPKSGAAQIQASADADVSVRPERKHLFQGLVFIFMNRRHCEMYSEIIEKAGGTYKELNTGVKKTFLSKSNVVVVQYVPSTASQSSETISSIMDYLELHSRRLIPEYEIGQAIVYCSTEKYCNPAYKIATDLVSEAILTGEDLSELVIPSTEKNPLNIDKLTDVVVEETPATASEEDEDCMATLRFTESVSKECQNKRKRSNERRPFSDSSDDENENLSSLAKRSHLENVTKTVTNVGSKNIAQPRGVPIAASKSKVTPKSSAKPLPRTVFSSTNRRTINVEGFLERSQAANALKKTVVDVVENVSSAKTTTETRKRNRIALITDDDDGDDDLFCFTENKNTTLSPNKKRSRRIRDNDSEEDDLFEFTNSAKHSETEAIDLDDDNALEPTELFVPRNKGKNNKTPITVPKPKVLPRTINIDGWLSRTLTNINIKTEADSNIESKETKHNSDASMTHNDILINKSQIIRSVGENTVDYHKNRKCFMKTPSRPMQAQKFKMVTVVAGPNHRAR